MVYGSEAILPANVMWGSPAVKQYDEGVAEDSRRVDIDSLEEARCATLSNQQGTSRVFDATTIATSRNAPSMLAI
jgi:hypothetical protein